jgi:hypothetical protein
MKEKQMNPDVINAALSDPLVHVGGGGLSIGGLLWYFLGGSKKRLDVVEPRVDKVEKDIFDARLEIKDLHSYAEGNYAKNSSLDRVHARIDDVAKTSNQILQLLVEKK